MNHRRRQVCLLFGLWLGPLGSIAMAASSSCETIRPWLDSQARVSAALGKGMRAVDEAQEAEWAARTQAARSLIEGYWKGAPDLVDLSERCLRENPQRQDFLNSIQAGLFEQSMARLRAARAPILRSLITAVDRVIGPRGAALFRMTGHSPMDASPTENKGGFHRGMKSIFMDVGRVSPQEWLLIFTHELLHSVDPMLTQAVRAYSQPELLLHLGKQAQELTDPSVLSVEDRRGLDLWLEAGLGRGLWAEYRAWTMTFAAYDEGLREGLWPRIDWIERISSERLAGEPLSAFIYRYLDARSADPVEGIFSRPMIQSALREVRERYRRGRPPELGPLGALGSPGPLY